MRAAVVVEADAEIREIALVSDVHLGEQRFRRAPLLVSADHGRGAVRVVGAEEAHLVTARALEAHPHVGLDVPQQVATWMCPFT